MDIQRMIWSINPNISKPITGYKTDAEWLYLQFDDQTPMVMLPLDIFISLGYTKQVDMIRRWIYENQLD